MASCSEKQLFCIFHVGGAWVKTSKGESIYDGGTVNGRMITKGITYTELRRLVATDVWPESTDFNMKYKVMYAEETLLDLVDDVGVAQLIDYNNLNGHVYVCKKDKDLNGSSELESREEMEHLLTPSLGSSICPQPIQSIPRIALVESEERVSTPDSLVVERLATPMPVMNSAKWKDELRSVGQTFGNGSEFRNALYKYSIAHNFSYVFVRNGKDRIIVKCKVDYCPWTISAYAGGKKSSFLTVRNFMKEHMHYAQDNLVVQQKKRCTMTFAIIIDELRTAIDKSPNDIRHDLQREYGLSLDYQQAYRAKQKALVQIHGHPEESYMLIPWLCQRLQESDADNVAKWVASSSNRFEAVFIAYGCCIKGFLEGARRILYVDGCHLSGPYKGTLLGAQAYDADNQLFPVAYAIVGGETMDYWSWFLQNIKDITGSMEVTIVSDRHNAIKSAVAAIFGGHRHVYCYRHVKENYSVEFSKITRGKRKLTSQSKDTALHLLDAIAYARLDEDFNEAMGSLMEYCPEMVEWLESNGEIDRWAKSRFPYKRWDNITTNLAESFNAWLVKERKHNVAVLIHEHREKLAQKLYKCKLDIDNWKNGVGPNVEAKLMENVAKSGQMDVLPYGMDRYRVRTGRGDLKVDLTLKKCSCKAWDMSGLPCPHACAAIKYSDGSVYQYVEDCYLHATQKKIYDRPMIPVETYDIPRPDTLRYEEYSSSVLLQPPLTSRPPGRPRSRRIESQRQDKKVFHCSRCGEAGHTLRTCRNPNPS